MAENLTMSFKTPLPMRVDTSTLDECSGELSRHTPTPLGISPLFILEIEKNPRIIDRQSANHHFLRFNAFFMVPSSKKKEKVQVQLLKKGTDRIIMPTMADYEYRVVVLGKDISHYVTRIGAVFKLMVQVEMCQLCTFYTDYERTGHQNMEELHSALFIDKKRCSADTIQSVCTVKITLASVGVDRYSEKFLVSVLFVKVPVEMQELYKKTRREHGMR